ncbi:hypothetical protein MASR1M60_10570 [Rhodocyclaceae bacterium]
MWDYLARTAKGVVRWRSRGAYEKLDGTKENWRGYGRYGSFSSIWDLRRMSRSDKWAWRWHLDGVWDWPQFR